MESTASAPSTSGLRGYVIALVGTALWSGSAVFIRYLTEHYRMPPLVLAFWRDLFVALTLFAALALIRPGLLRLPRRHLPFFVLYGVVLVIFNSMWTVSVALNGASVATVLVYSSPAITAVSGWLLWRESLGPLKIAAVLLSLVGCVFVSGAHSAELWRLNAGGIVIGLVSGLMLTAYSIFGKMSSQRDVNPWTALTYTFAFAAVFFFLLLQAPLDLASLGLGQIGSGSELMWLGGDLVGWGVLILLVWGPTIGGYGLYTVSLVHLPASVANLIASLEPSMTAALAYVFLGERMTEAQVIGSIMIVAGVVLLRVRARGERRVVSP
jgi:drug/metabolite transporter (DMT)-like permease